MTNPSAPETSSAPADDLAAVAPDAAPLPAPETSTPMLDVHAPHETIHSWKNFLVHIAAIVVGLIIAVSLEQTVEFFHHREQRQELEAALRRDGEANRGYVRDDIANAQAILDWALAQSSALERAGPAAPLTLQRLPRVFIGSPDAGVWPSAKASGVTLLLPPSAQNWLEYLAQQYDETFVAAASAGGQLSLAYEALDKAILGHATALPSGDIDLSTLPAEQRAAAVDGLRAIAEHARDVLRHLLIYDAGNDFILTVPLDQLDTPEAGARYSQIYAEKMKSHPAANFAFGGY